MIDIDSLEPTIASVAGKYGAMYRKYGAEREDFAQELRIWALENQDIVAEWLDPEVTDEKYGMKQLVKALENECNDYAVDIKAQAVGYHREDLYWYGRNELRALLPAMFDPESRTNPPQSDDDSGRSSKSDAEGGNWVATLADVSRAYDALGREDKFLLSRFHRDGFTNKEMAKALDVTEAMMSYYHSRALNRLLDNAGGAAPRPMRRSEKGDPWRGRRAITNAEARYLTDSTWESA